MLTINFKSLNGNSASDKRVNKQLNEYSTQLVGALFTALKGLGLNESDREAVTFIEQVNTSLQLQFAQCKTESDALAKFTHYVDFGERRFYSVTNPTTSLFDLLGNLITGYRLYKANKLVSKQADKPLLFSEYIATKKLSAELLALPAVVDGLFTQYVGYLLSLQLSDAVIIGLVKKDSDKRYKRTESQVKTALASLKPAPKPKKDKPASDKPAK